ncbi:MAG: sigma 54-interacting transcriptional regulator [Pseudomonadota bacterium]
MARMLEYHHFPLILDVLDQGVFTVDQSGIITSFNRAAEMITGCPTNDAIGSSCADVFRTNLCREICPLRQSIQSRTKVRNREVYISTKHGRPIPISVSTAPLVATDGRLLGGVEVFRDLSGLVDLKRRLDSRYRLADIIGKSQAMRRLFDLIPLVAASSSTILITGASGTGKELVARTIHATGPRKKGPFVAINCAAIPETLLESELFGYRRGAFTDARQDRSGRIAAAEGGTLFLDEIGDLSPPIQVKILRFLQDRVYEPLGAARAVRADVRVVAATNRDLNDLVNKGQFREDLFFRLNVVQIEIPPLHQRMEDVPLLAEHYVQAFRHSTGRPIEGFTEEAMAALMGHSFPGNVRELENIVERAFILCPGDRIGTQHLPATVVACRSDRHAESTSLEAAELAAIQAALARHDGNRTRAAADLGIHRITLLRKLKRLGVE